MMSDGEGDTSSDVLVMGDINTEEVNQKSVPIVNETDAVISERLSMAQVDSTVPPSELSDKSLPSADNNTPIKEKLLNAAHTAGTVASNAAHTAGAVASHAASKSTEVAVKITGEVAEVVGKVSTIVVEKTETVVKRFTHPEVPVVDNVESKNESNWNDAKGSTEISNNGENINRETDMKSIEERPSFWGKVRRLSGAAVAQAHSAASNALKAAEPLSQKAGNTVANVSNAVSDSAKAAYERGKPLAEATATRVAEGASAAWNVTKESTAHVVDRARTFSSSKSSPQTIDSTVKGDLDSDLSVKVSNIATESIDSTDPPPNL